MRRLTYTVERDKASSQTGYAYQHSYLCLNLWLLVDGMTFAPPALPSLPPFLPPHSLGSLLITLFLSPPFSLFMEERKSFHQPTTTNSSTNNCVGKRSQSVNLPCLSQRYRSSASRVTRPRRAQKYPNNLQQAGKRVNFIMTIRISGMSEARLQAKSPLASGAGRGLNM